MHSQFAMFDRAPKLGQQFHPRTGSDMVGRLGGVDQVADLAVFGPVHGDVGMAQQGSDITTVLGADGDADAGVSPHVQSIELDRLIEGRDQRGGSLQRLFGTGVRKQYGEFVAAETGQDVSLA